MESLQQDELLIAITEGNPLIIKWTGVCQDKNPGASINPYFDKIAAELGPDPVIVSFTELDYMNSSTISPIIYMCKLLDKKNIKTVLQYNKASDWQHAVFKGLNTLSRMMKNITVEAVDLPAK